MEQVSLHLPTTLVSAGFGADVAGRFNLVQRIVARPLAIIGTSVSVVLISDAGRRLRARLDLRPVLMSAIRRLASLAAVLFLPMAMIGPQLLPWLLGTEWTDAGRYLLALIPGVAADFIATPVFPILGLVERPWTQVFGSALRLAAIAIAILGSAAAGLAPVVMMWMFSIAMVFVGIITIWWCRAGIETTGHESSRRGNMTT
jgi:O-antigen/teichoic acid export membrane protein